MTARAGALYTPEVLAAATGLAAWPWNDALPFTGQARSRSCGSTLALGLDRDAAGRITALGLRAQACAIGQAAAAVFAGHALGQDRAAIAAARAELGAWLAGAREAPHWPGLAVIAVARDYPARHGAVVLAWDAALAAFDGAGEEGTR